MQLALMRYCKTHGLTKTEALARGVDLLLASERDPRGHPAFGAFERLRARLPKTVASKSVLGSVDSIKRRLDEKYPG